MRASKTGKFLLIFFLCLFGILGIAPTVISSSWGKEKLLDYVNKTSLYKISCESVHLSWFGKQEFSGLKVQGPHALSCDLVKTSAPLWKILFRKQVDALDIIHPSLQLDVLALNSVKSSIPEPLQASFFPALHIKFSPFFTGVISLQNGSLFLVSKEKTLARYDNISAEITVPSTKTPIEFSIEGKTEENGKQGSFLLKGCSGVEGSFFGEFTNFPLSGPDALLTLKKPELKGLLLLAFGPTLNLSGTLSPAGLDLKAASSNFNAQVQAHAQDDSIVLTNPAVLNFILTPELAHVLKKATQIRVEVDSFSLPQQNFQALAFSAKVRTDPLLFAARTVDSLTCNLQTDCLETGIKGSVTALEKATGSQLRVDVEHLKPALDNLEAQGNFYFTSNLLPIKQTQGTFAVAGLEAITMNAQVALPKEGWTLEVAKKGSLNLKQETCEMAAHVILKEQNTQLAEMESTLSAQKIFSKNPEAQIALKALGEAINVQGTLFLKGGYLFLKKEPLEIFYTMTDDSFEKAQLWFGKTEKIPFKLVQPSVLAWTISKFNVPVATFDFAAMELNAEGGLSRFSFQETATGNTIKLDNLHLSLQKQKEGPPLSFQLASQVSTKSPSGITQEGSIRGQGHFTEIADLHRPSLDFSLDLTEFPPALFDLASHFTGGTSLAPLFGEKLDAKIETCLAQGSGPVLLNISSPHTRLSLDGSVNAGVLTLKEPIYSQVFLTEELSAFFINKANLFSISSLASPNPLTLEIANNGFSLPLYAWRTLSFQKAKLELGQLTCRNEGTFQITLGLLKSKQLLKDKTLHLWFAPCDLSAQEGIISVERTEILVAKTYEICIWGKVNLVDETVDMTLGLTAQALNKAFGIKNLPPDYVMHIPMKGKMNNVQVNTKSATAKIAALLLWQDQAGQEIQKGLPGLGDLIGKLATLPDKSANTPPAKHPFPWEVYKPDGKELKENPDASRNKKKRIKKDDKPLKQLFKLLR